MWTINIYSEKLFTCHTTHIVSHNVRCTVKHFIVCTMYTVMCCTCPVCTMVCIYIYSFISFQNGLQMRDIARANKSQKYCSTHFHFKHKLHKQKTEVKCRKRIERTRIFRTIKLSMKPNYKNTLDEYLWYFSLILSHISAGPCPQRNDKLFVDPRGCKVGRAINSAGSWVGVSWMI